MKTKNLLAILAFIALISCHTGKNPDATAIDFGIYESEQSLDPSLYDLDNMIKVIGLDDIRKTKTEGAEVIIYFNIDGAKKWADMTRNNIGKAVAFVIDDKIVCTPTIAGELRNGVAKINGIGNEANAISLSESLNASIPK